MITIVRSSLALATLGVVAAVPVSAIAQSAQRDGIGDLLFYVLIRCVGQGLGVGLPTKILRLETKKFHAEISSSPGNS